MSCTNCTTTFNASNSLNVTLLRNGGNVLLYMQNQSRNIINVQRAMLCITYANGTSSTLYLRPGSGLTYGTIEQGLTYLEYSIALAAGVTVQAEAEYTEVDGRSVSCVYNL